MMIKTYDFTNLKTQAERDAMHEQVRLTLQTVLKFLTVGSVENQR